MLFVHILPLAQEVHPVQPIPPHWAYFAAEQPVGVVAGVDVVLVEVDSVVGWAVVLIDVVVVPEPPPPPPDELPHDQTAGPGTV